MTFKEFKSGLATEASHFFCVLIFALLVIIEMSKSIKLGLILFVASIAGALLGSKVLRDVITVSAMSFIPLLTIHAGLDFMIAAGGYSALLIVLYALSRSEKTKFMLSKSVMTSCFVILLVLGQAL